MNVFYHFSTVAATEILGHRKKHTLLYTDVVQSLDLQLDTRSPIEEKSSNLKEAVVGLTSDLNQSGYELLNLENGSFLNSDNFDATNLRFKLKVKFKLKPNGIV